MRCTHQHLLGVTVNVDLPMRGPVRSMPSKRLNIAQGNTGLMYRAEMNIRHSRPADFQLILN
jgi:hypothetical protein